LPFRASSKNFESEFRTTLCQYSPQKKTIAHCNISLV
jgi:hypothetical protein